MPRRHSSFDLHALIHAVRPAWATLGAPLREGDDLTACAIASSGFAALIGLPMLLIASVVFSAPLAVPAAISVGYLATSYALASRHPRGAAAINAVVLVGLVVWSSSVMLGGEELSRSGLAAALLAPAFAAAPAVARLAIAPRADRVSAAALRNAACLDRLAPAEAVLVVRRDGTLLAATRAARASLRLSDEAIGTDIGRHVALVDRPKLAAAIASCPRGEAPIEVALQSGGTSHACTAEISSAEDGAVSLRLLPAEVQAPLDSGTSRRSAEAHAKERDAAMGPVCDVGEAVAFAMRRGEENAEAKRAGLTAEVEGGLRARCELQAFRRMLHLMFEGALMQAGVGDRLHLTARGLKSVALLRLVRVPALDDSERPAGKGHDDWMALREVVEAAGGTLLVEESPAEMRLSVRLELGNRDTGDDQAG